jgi:hypothetical protein
MECCGGNVLLCIVLWAFAGYAYRVNAKRSTDDPEKRDYHPAAIILAPLTWPFFLSGLILLFVIRALLYGIFLILFTIALVVIRKPFILAWLDKIAKTVGNKLLKVNSFLARQLFPLRTPQNG